MIQIKQLCTNLSWMIALGLLQAYPLISGAAASKTITIGVKGDTLAFDKTTLTAKPGEEIKLVFTNNASKASNMIHNWVLVNPGTGDAVGTAAMSAGPDKGYLPVSTDILAHTKLLNPGEKDSIVFKAPEKAGEYPYICTFPGHFTMMKGVLNVK